MLATSHALVGATLVRVIPDPRISLPLAFLSHFFLDRIPHWDTATDIKSRPLYQTCLLTVLDVLFGFFLVFLLFSSTSPVLLFWGILAAQIVDWVESPYYFLNWQFPPFSWIYQLQSLNHHRQALPWGLVTQVILVIPLLWWTLGR